MRRSRSTIAAPAKTNVDVQTGIIDRRVIVGLVENWRGPHEGRSHDDVLVVRREDADIDVRAKAWAPAGQSANGG